MRGIIDYSGGKSFVNNRTMYIVSVLKTYCQTTYDS